MSQSHVAGEPDEAEKPEKEAARQSLPLPLPTSRSR